jgi:hypothetical protein
MLIRALGPWDPARFGPVDWSSTGMSLVFSLCIVAVLILSARKGVLSLPGVLQLLFLVLMAFAAANVIWRFADLISYGDSGRFSTFIDRNRVFPRWFLGSVIMTRLYHHVWSELGGILPETLSSADGLVRIAGAVLMAASSLVLLRIDGLRLAVLVPVLSPIWLMLSTGYSEYYPFIAFVYLGFIYMIQSGDLSRRSPVTVALVSSLLCLSYTAFVPLGFLLIACYGISSGIRKASVALAVTFLLCVAMVFLLWPGTFDALSTEFRKHLNLGEMNTHYPAYMGKSAGDSTPFFALSYAFSIEHILHLCFMGFFGAGLVPLFLICLALPGLHAKGSLASLAKTKAALFLGLVLAFQILYFILMIPKLGPVRDIDLFFTVYLTFGFIAGYIEDIFLDTMSEMNSDIFRNCVVGSCVGSSAVILLFMLRTGIVPS